MKMIFAPDSFKGSLTAVQAANILQEQALAPVPGGNMRLCARGRWRRGHHRCAAGRLWGRTPV